MAVEASFLGDFDDDGQLTPNDIDLLSAEMLANSGDAKFDIDADGVVDSLDRQLWVEDEAYANTFLGDTNIDGEVNFTDFLALSLSFGGNGGWGEGDFDGNGRVEFPDFLALSANFGQSATTTASVPEPSSPTVLLIMLGLLTAKRRRPSCV